MAIKVAPIKSLLSKWYMLPSSCLCLFVCVCFICPFACDYVKIGLWAVELLKMNYYYYYYCYLNCLVLYFCVLLVFLSSNSC
jgi:hypothetical protein